MARGPQYKVKFRRRREGKTDYYQRKKLLLSGLPRFVVRVSTRHVYAQVTEARPEGDHVIVSACSRELVRDFGWKGDTNNTPAAYLVGFLAALKALRAGIEKAVLDIGLRRASKGARVFAALKGAIDAGLEIPHGEEILPSDERIRGEHVKEYAELLLSSDPDRYNSQFSKYLSRGLKPERLPEHFQLVKEKILKKFKGGRRE